MRSPPLFRTAIALAIISAYSLAQEPAESGPGRAGGVALTPIAEQIDALVAEHHAHRGFTGVALVADRGKILYQGAFGLANDDRAAASATH